MIEKKSPHVHFFFHFHLFIFTVRMIFDFGSERNLKIKSSIIRFKVLLILIALIFDWTILPRLPSMYSN